MPIKSARTSQKAKRKALSEESRAYVDEISVSPNEKHRLIMAHAAMRPPQNPSQYMHMWAGVLVATFAVLTGWWWSVGSGIASNFTSVGMQEVVESVSPHVETPVDKVEKSFEKFSEQLQQLNQQADAREAVLKEMQNRLTTSTQELAPQ